MCIFVRRLVYLRDDAEKETWFGIEVIGLTYTLNSNIQLKRRIFARAG